MPDGDRFQRTLRGKGWAKAYRLACSNQSLDLICDRLKKAVAEALRGPLACHSLAKIREAVHTALIEKAQGGRLNFEDQPLADPFRMLTDLLDDIVAEDSHALSTELAAKAARSVYLRLQRDCEKVTSGQIQEQLSREYGEWVVRHQFLARVREGIALKNDRTPEEQMAWEDGLFSSLAEDLRKTVDQLYQSDRKVAVRAPRRRTPQRKMTIEELHQGIAVLEV